MKKLKLNLDEIKVESFEISKADFSKGTIFALESTDPNEVGCGGTGGPVATEEVTVCNGYSCPITCIQVTCAFCNVTVDYSCSCPEQIVCG